MPKRAAAVPATGIRLDPASGVPRHRQVYERLRDRILSGQLASGVRLPSSRALAAELGVSRTTVLAAYERLRDEGYLDGQVGSGTTVAKLPTPPPPARPQPRARDRPPRLSHQGQAMADDPLWAGPPPGAGRHAFQVGVPALDAFPTELWARTVARSARRRLTELLDYQDPAGYRPLREAIAAHLGMARGVRCTAEQVLIVGGSQAGLSLAARLLLDSGDTVWVEDPGYYGARGAVAGVGATPVPVPLDGEGLDLAAALRRAPTARLAVVTPSHQYPLGVTMSLPRRLALLEWARTSDAHIVENDYDSEFVYVGNPLPALQGLDRDDRVIYVGSFSKSMFPALRLGYVIVPNTLMQAFTAGHMFDAVHAPVLEQAALADFIADGHFARHLRRMRALYARRGAALVRAAHRELPGLLTVAPARAGLHLIGWLPHGTNDTQATARAIIHGIHTEPLSASAVEPYPRPGLLLGYAAVPETDIPGAVRQLAAALRQR